MLFLESILPVSLNRSAPIHDLSKAQVPDQLRLYWLQVQAGPEKVKSRKQTAKEKVLRSKAMGDASRVQPVVWYGSM